MKTTVIAITGPSGFNKSFLVKEALTRNPDLVLIPAYTDKPIEDVITSDTQFKHVSEEEFTRMVDAERFLEWQRLLSNNYRYGKTKEDFTKIIQDNPGKIILNVINVINLPLLKRYYPEVKSIFIDVKDTPSLIELLKKSPDVNDNEEFERRLKFATEERRRRHLADITINMDESNPQQSIESFLNAINKLGQ